MSHDHALGPTPKPRHDGLLPLAVIGCDFRVASTAWRNAALLDADARRSLLDGMRRAAGARGIVVLETCNRVEWWIDAPDPRWAADLARAAMVARWQPRLPAGSSPPQPYVHVGEDGVRHLARVVVGLESFVAGEREIAGQLNRAMDAAREAGATSPDLNALQTSLGRVVRAVERGTAFRAHGRGVHALAVDVLRARLGAAPSRVLVIGMGEIGRKAAALAERERAWGVLRLNRTVDAAHEGAWHRWDELPRLLAEVDAVVIATGARTPVLTQRLIGEALDAAGRRGDGRGTDQRPLWIVDLGAPGQAELPAADESRWRRMDLDDLLISHAPLASSDELHHVHALVEDAVIEHRGVLRRREQGPLLRQIWDGYDDIAWQRLPALVERFGTDLSDEARRGLLDGVRDALRDHARRLIESVDIAEPKP